MPLTRQKLNTFQETVQPEEINDMSFDLGNNFYRLIINSTKRKKNSKFNFFNLKLPSRPYNYSQEMNHTKVVI